MEEENIGKRIERIIYYKANSKTEFADSLGWSKPYLSQLLKGEKGIGINPIKQIASVYKDIDIRWLLTGEGSIFGDFTTTLAKRVEFLLSLEKYIPVMSDIELDTYLSVIIGKDEVVFSRQRINRWEELMKEKNLKMQAKIEEAMKQSIVAP